MPITNYPPLSLTFRITNLKLALLIVLLSLSVASQAQTPSVFSDSLSSQGFPAYVDTAREATNFTALQAKKQKEQKFLKTAALVTAGAGVWTATYALADEPLQEFTQSNRSSFADGFANIVEPLGRQKHLAPVAGAAIVGGVLLKDDKLKKAGIVSLGSILANAVVTNSLKNAFRRHRPNATTENHLFDGPLQETDNTSLPSSHTSTAFAVATSVATVYKDHKFVPPIAYGVASLVGLSRINDNAHWATDVIAGAAVGYFTSKGVTYLYDVVNQKLNARKYRLQIAPQVGLQTRGVSATLTF